MTRISFATIHDRLPWFRQTPRGDGVWGQTRFEINTGFDSADWLVAFDDIPPGIATTIAPDRRVLVISEPPGMKHYRPDFINQFGTLISPMPVPGFRGRTIAHQPGIPWFIGLDLTVRSGPIPSRYTFADLASLPYPTKAGLLSAVVSTKATLPKHKRRLAFVLALKDRLGDRFALHGRGFDEVDDKADAILPYRWHLVLENNDEPHFFTEKLADALIGWSMPIFSGCANITDYIAPPALRRLDIEAPHAIERIEAWLSEPITPADIAGLAEARVAILHTHNLFAVLDRLLVAPNASDAPRLPYPARLQPNTKPPSLLKRMRRQLQAWWRTYSTG